jgi:hypothetical protein
MVVALVVVAESDMLVVAVVALVVAVIVELSVVPVLSELPSVAVPASSAAGHAVRGASANRRVKGLRKFMRYSKVAEGSGRIGGRAINP